MSTNDSISITTTANEANRLKFLRKKNILTPSLRDSMQKKLQAAVSSIITEFEGASRIQPESWEKSHTCPKCKSGSLVVRLTKKPPVRKFFGCSLWPECKHSESLKENINAKENS
jgi:ssDNA-binding Zn-finger/Zn-ribbon topoisomerase 1